MTKLNALLTSLWPLLSTVIFSMLVSCTHTECMSQVDHLASNNTPFDS